METESKKIRERIATEKKLFIEQLRKTPVFSVVCERVNIGRATAYRWVAKDKKFQVDVQKALSEGTEMINDMAISALISSIADKNLGAVKFWLSNKSKDFSPKLEVSTNQEKQKVQSLSKEQEDLIRKAVMLVAPIEEEIEDEK